jgi:hypothetical protein
MTLPRNLFLFLLILFLIISSCKKEELISTPNISISLEGEYDDLCSNENNEIIMIGTNDDYIPPSYCNDFIIVKTDQDGNLVWSKKYILDFWVEPQKIVRTAPGVYFIAINNHIEHPQWGPVVSILILQINDAGDTIHTIRMLSRWGIIFKDMIPDQNNGVIVTALVDGDENPGGVAKINDTGEIEFFHQFPYRTEQLTQYPLGEICYMEHAFLNNDTTGVTVHLTSPIGDDLFQSTVLQDNDFIFTRFSEDPNHLIMFYSNGNGKFLTKTDFDSQVVWSERVKFTDSDKGDIRDLRKIGTSYYCLGDHGWQPDGLSVIKYDESGEMLFHKNLLFDSKNYSDEVHFTELNNGDLVFLQPPDNYFDCEGYNCYILQIFK